MQINKYTNKQSNVMLNLRRYAVASTLGVFQHLSKHISIRSRNKFGITVFIGLFVYSFIGLLVLFPKPAHAEDLSLGIYPPVIQITATPPTDIKSPMTISNLSDNPVHVQILVRPFTASSSDNGELQYLDSHARVGEDPQIFQKMSIFDGEKNTSSIDLAPRQQKNIELRVHIPQEEPSSDYYFSITFLSKPIKGDQQSNSAVAGGISTNVLLSIGPQGKTTGNIQEFSAPFFTTEGPVPFSVKVNNTSKHFISPQGTILIKNMFGQTIGKVDLLPVNILSNTSRFLPSENALDTRAYWPEKFLLGPYSATITLALSGEGPLYRRTIYFFALPVQVLIGIILGIILITVIVYRVKKQLSQ